MKVEFRAWDYKNNRMVDEDVLKEQSFGDLVVDYALDLYIGKNDIHGKKIFDGDIVKLKSYNYQHFNGYNWEVYYCEDSAMFKLRTMSKNKWAKEYSETTSDFYGVHSFEIIGNKYENSELIPNNNSQVSSNLKKIK